VFDGAAIFSLAAMLEKGAPTVDVEAPKGRAEQVDTIEDVLPDAPAT